MSSKFFNQSPARHTIVASLAALILAAPIPQIAFAASDAGIWKVNAAKSKFNSKSATLTIQRVEGAAPGTDSFVVISGAGVYWVTGSKASDSAGLRPADFETMTKTGEAVLIGTHPRSLDECRFQCRAGLPEKVRTVTFRVVKTGEQQIRDMLASDDPDE